MGVRSSGSGTVPDTSRNDSLPSRSEEKPPSVGAVDNTAPTLFFRVGGMPFFEDLVDAFYEGVATDEVLLPLYPEQPAASAGAIFQVDSMKGVFQGVITPTGPSGCQASCILCPGRSEAMVSP